MSTTRAEWSDPKHSSALYSATSRRQLRDRHPLLSERFCPQRGDAILHNQVSTFGTKPQTAAMLQAIAREVFTDGKLATFDRPTPFIVAENGESRPPDVAANTVVRIPRVKPAIVAAPSHSAYGPDSWNLPLPEFISRVP